MGTPEEVLADARQQDGMAIRELNGADIFRLFKQPGNAFVAKQQDGMAIRDAKIGKDTVMTQQSDPGSTATMGGMVSVGSSALDAGYYEPTRDPWYNLVDVANSSVLPQTIEAIARGAVGNDYDLEALYRIDDVDENGPEMIEKDALEMFHDTAAIGDTYMSIWRTVLRQMHTIGYSPLEVTRTLGGRVAGMYNIKYPMEFRICPSGSPIVKDTIWTSKRTGKQFTLPVETIYRRFVQMPTTGSQVFGRSFDPIFFKEFGDPRTMDRSTGTYKDGVKWQEQATSIAWFAIASMIDPIYGSPHWTGTLALVKACNGWDFALFNYVQHGRHNQRGLMALNAKIQGVAEQVVRRTENQGIGPAESMKIYVASFMSGENYGAGPLDESKSIAEALKEFDLSDKFNDVLWKLLNVDARETIRSTFNVSRVMIGETKDYNRATSNTGKEATEEQVLTPNRQWINEWHNEKLYPEMGIKHHLFKCRSTATTNEVDMLGVINASEHSQAVVTVGELRAATRRATGFDLMETEGNPYWEAVQDMPVAEFRARIQGGVPMDRPLLQGATEDVDLLAESATQSNKMLHGLGDVARSKAVKTWLDKVVDVAIDAGLVVEGLR